MAGIGRRIGARAIDGLAQGLLLIIPWLLVPGDRLFARLFVVAAGIAAYEAVFTVAFGATPGKLLCGIRIAELDGAEAVSPGNAVRRGVVVGVCSATAIFALIGPVVLLLSVLQSPLRRGMHDRLARTFVVGGDAPRRISSAEVQTFEQIAHTPAMTRFGPAADLDIRRRARANRLDNAPLLVLGVVALAATVSFPFSNLLIVVIMAALWLPLFVVDETWRISRHGATAGHRKAGLIVVNVDTGEPPTPRQALARAIVLAPLLYLPPLQAVLALWVKASSDHRGPHDRAGHTVVITNPNPPTAGG